MNNRDYFYIDRKYEGFEELAEDARLWNVQMTQLNCGRSVNKMKQLSLERVNLNLLQLNGHKTTVGDTPPGRTFAFFSGDNSELIWRRKKVRPNDIMIYPNRAEHDVMTKGKNIQVHTITFTDALWEAALPEREAANHRELLPSHELVSLSACDMLKLKHFFLSYFTILERAPEVLEHQSFRRGVEEQIFFAITQALSSTTYYRSTHSSKKTTQKVWDKIDLILKKAGDSVVPVKELCLAAGVSERSLRRFFHDRYGISPKNYLNRTRLGRVRRELMNCSVEENTIADVANNHGFWHMGQFAADYRKLFGELPSATLKTSL